MTLANMLANNAFPNEYQDKISNLDLENSFTVTVDDNGFYKFNLNSTIVIDPNAKYNVYQINQDMHWPLISYKLYGDTKVVWMLLKINEVQFEDVFKPVKSGTYIKYLEPKQISQITSIMYNL